jgi:hypothetical protein
MHTNCLVYPIWPFPSINMACQGKKTEGHFHLCLRRNSPRTISLILLESSHSKYP